MWCKIHNCKSFDWKFNLQILCCRFPIHTRLCMPCKTVRVIYRWECEMVQSCPALQFNATGIVLCSMFLQIWRCSNEQNWDCMMSPFTERCESTQSEIHTCNKGGGVTHILNRLCKSDLALTTTGRGRGL